jgi:uncharacterized membrane protein
MRVPEAPDIARSDTAAPQHTLTPLLHRCLIQHAILATHQLSNLSLTTPSATFCSQRMGSYSAPPVVVAPVYASPFGFGMPFFGGYGGFGYGIPMFGGLFQFFFLSIMISVVFNVISGFVNRSSSGSSKKSSKLDSEDWDEL